ncbi:Vitamin B12 import ATP-binding protein BtuD [Sporomusa silvacetica DSM 10669]|uniref:Vitamin B12 import ATP-binding protein BtuD n=1 Tax=Sporomusa silvacetica DSM 10669 TaxID=1123289 RepID=A0ABZ3IJP7_9FIRM|nr:ABC transporter ATP-binding protein [Sporomusa silvacetica]OZC18432.1 glycine betaine/carnitine/choline transport ATP-binding protein OpuCA [Sporomusa silvacetica DSM 10669]
MRQVVLEIADIKVFRNKRQTLKIENLSISAGEIVAIIGPNGAGKSTLLQLINMHLSYKTGKMVLFGEDVAGADKQSLRRRSSMVFQETMLLDDTVFNNVALALRFRGLPEREIKEKVTKALADFHCAHLTTRMAGNLSGGEAQRVCLARALVYEPELLLLDEPFAALDSPTRNTLLAELRLVAIARGTTVMLVSHNFNDVLYFAERAVVLQEGCIVQDDTPEVILRRPVNAIIASLIEMDNVLPCQVEKQGDDILVQLANGVYFPWTGQKWQGATVCCLPGDALYIFDEQLVYQYNSLMAMEGIVSQVVPGIGMYRIMVETQGLSLTMRVPREQVTSRVAIGMQLKIAFNPGDVQLV